MLSLRKLTLSSLDRLAALHSLGQGTTLDSSDLVILSKGCPSILTTCRVPRPTGNLNIYLLVNAPLAKAVEYPPSLTCLILQRRKVVATRCLQATQPLACLPPTLRLQDLLACLRTLFSRPTPCHLALNVTANKGLP